jgi:predicted short-subunit dehydrogenase-like oxidoreductase (DUF2520 family)
MRVAVVGPGRLGTLLAVACSRAGHRVVAVGGGSLAARERLGGLVAGVRPHEEATDAARGADLVLLAVPDDRLVDVATDLARADAIHDGQRIVHVAGARGPDVLDLAARAGARVAACHPAMTVPIGSTDPGLLVGVAWAVTCTPTDRPWADEFVRELGGDPHVVPADRRKLYHAALAVGSNAVAAAVATARQLLLAAAVDEPAAFLGPLAHASVDAVADRGAVAITGPISRGDASTVAGHLDAIRADVPSVAETYRLLALATLSPLRPQLDAETLAVLDSLLGSAGSGERHDARDRGA